MKTLLMIISTLCLVASCDAPQRTRAPVEYISGNGAQTQGMGNAFLGTNGVTSGSTTGVPTTGSPDTSPGFENCDLTQKYQTIDIGFFGICRSTQDETTIKFRPSLTIQAPSPRVCLIPTYRDANGSSTYIGNPQCTFTTSNVVVQGKLYKDRSDFQNYPLNGVIVMREPLLAEYISCMHGYVNWPGNACTGGATSRYCSNWPNVCPYGARTNPQCDIEARNYMAGLCNGFKTKYGNAYIDISLR
jgi:hypothetical protein